MTLVASLVAMVSLGSCEKVPLLAPTASTITIVSNRTVLPINGTAQIIATVIEQSGSPAHNGTLVTFTTTLGTLAPREAVTDNGQAVVDCFHLLAIFTRMTEKNPRHRRSLSAGIRRAAMVYRQG